MQWLLMSLSKRFLSLKLISVTSRIEKTWRTTSQPKLTAASFTIFFKRQQHRGKKRITEFWTPKKKQNEVLLNYCNCRWNNPTKALPEWIGYLNTSKKLLPYSWILNMLSLGKSSMFSWHSKAQSWTYSLFALGDKSHSSAWRLLGDKSFFQIKTECSLLYPKKPTVLQMAMVTVHCIPKLYIWQQFSEESGPQHLGAQ